MVAKQIGLTGNIGSGKTTVGRLFETIGVPVYYADDHAKRLLNTPEVASKVKTIFGNDCIAADGLPDRKALAKKVFADVRLLQKINEIIHPLVGMDFERWTENYADHPYVIMEAAILFETERAKQLYKNILVTAPEQLRIRRVCERDGVAAEDVRKRMQHQLPEAEKVQIADFVINNNGEEPLIPQVERIHQSISASILESI